MLGVEEHSNLTLANPDVIAIWNAKGNSRQNVYATGNDRGHGNNAIVGFKKNEYRFYNIEVGSGDNGTGTYQLKIRLNNICRINDDGEAHYNWFGGPKGYNKLETPADASTNLVLFVGTHNNNRVERAELHGFWETTGTQPPTRTGSQQTYRRVSSTPSGSGPRTACRKGSRPPSSISWGSTTRTGTQSAAPPAPALQGRKSLSPIGRRPAPESTTSPWEQRAPTGPASTGSASRRNFRTDGSPTQGVRQKARQTPETVLREATYGLAAQRAVGPIDPRAFPRWSGSSHTLNTNR